MPETNVTLHGWEVDALWRDRRLVLEIDGATFHHTPADINRDRAKDAALDAAGYTVIRVSYRQLRDAPETVIARIHRSLSRSGAPGPIT